MRTRRATSAPSAPAASVLAGVLAAIVVTACASTPSRTSPPQVPQGNPQRGAVDMERFGCGACHIIPGIRGAAGLVGPPLIHWSQRGYIAGEIPNNGPNLVLWIVDPRAIEPKTDMPDLGISESQARDIAAYLFSIH